MNNFVNCEWLFNNIKDSYLFIIDCRFDLFDASYGKKAYENSHIKNAYYLDINEDFCGKKGVHGGARPVADCNLLGEKLSNLGIRMDSKIVVYDDKLYSSPRAWWQLKYMGYENVFVLNGGFSEWKKKGFPISIDNPMERGEGVFKTNIKEAMYADIDYVKKALDDEDKALVDSRNEKRYTGEYEPLYHKKGHIKGAINIPYEKSIDENGKVKDEYILKENFKILEGKKEIITYCGSGIEAAINYIVLDEIGYKVRLYAGSVSDYISYDENELVTGKNV
ncbi:thiosulfate/3-mercaptopyruvate sulfurtransferase [Caloramator quimbayensis]|uniref:Thiosulfate/3-mercaptopyruvate sulfurtransferase n=1 Tax=Caloramator quimbayensis TaxID=1147123 RepID=A0A1T4XUK1_9CLOT|nr:sulfurtransferase [Caloramator quimbayensis]SKA93236.1 thiosulfate/3-mercaptopyruvate sulfurtransferase [Caloramator quimbayensis]